MLVLGLINFLGDRQRRLYAGRTLEGSSQNAANSELLMNGMPCFGLGEHHLICEGSSRYAVSCGAVRRDK